MNLVYATTNPGKFTEVNRLFAVHGLTLHAPSEYGVSLDVDETGSTLEENAALKAESYRDAIGEKVIVLGDDTGVEIDALGGEPGIRVRRWKGYKMTDEEIIAYTLERLHGVPAAKRGAQFRTVIAVAKSGQPTRTFSGIHRVNIRVRPLPLREAGFPFRSLIHDSAPTHRIKAVKSSLNYLATLMN